MNLPDGFIHRRPKLEKIQMSTSWWMDTQIMVYSINGIIFIYNKEHTVDSYSIIGEFKRTLYWLKKARDKIMLYDFI